DRGLPLGGGPETNHPSPIPGLLGRGRGPVPAGGAGAGGAALVLGGGRAGHRPLTSPGSPMTDPNQVRLLFGPYRPPLVRRGDRAHCLFRDGDVIVTGWSYGRIPWPRCRAEGTHGGG